MVRKKRSQRKGGKEIIKEYAEEHGTTVSGLMYQLLAEKIPRFELTDPEKSGWPH